MKRLMLGAVVVALALGAAPTPASAACADENASVQTTPAPRLRAAVICLVNAERTSRGLTALTENAQLDQAAQAHTQDMIARHYFEHVSPSPASTTPQQRVEAAGYDWGAVGEALAFGSVTPAGSVLQWLRSPSHCSAVLAAGYLHAGVGMAFGSPEPAPTTQSGVWTGVVGRLRSRPAPAGSSAPAAGCPYAALGLVPGGGGGPPGGSSPGTDARPTITALSVTNPTFAVNRAGAVAQRRPPRGTTFRFTLSESASVRFSIERRARGRRVGGRCVRPTRSSRRRSSCVRFVTVGAFTRTLQRGHARVAFSGRLRVRGSARSLSPARYRATVTATDRGGRRSLPKHVSLRVV